jgi:predicted acetyltransferase
MLAIVNVSVDAATPADVPVLDRLLQLYEYDFSEYGGVDLDASGVFETVDTAAIWRPDDHVYLIRVDGNLAGFAYVTRHTSYFGHGETHNLSEFFVLRKYRRRGVGEHVARLLFDRFPGRWEFGTTPGNLAAQAFWRRVLGRYAPDTLREVAEGCERWSGPIWVFVSGADGVRRASPSAAPRPAG